MGPDRGDKFLLDQDRERLDFPRTLKAFQSLTARHPAAGAKLVENKANGPAVIQTLRNKISGIIAINPQGDKVARAHGVSPQVEAGNVYLPHPAIAPWVYDFIERAAAFPNAAFKDEIDAMTQALARLMASERKRQNSGRSHSSRSMR